MTDLLLLVAMISFPISEIALLIVKRSRIRSAREQDRGSLIVLWLGILFGLVLANVAQLLPVGSLPTPQYVNRLLALTFLVIGLAVRWKAILTLGRLFTVDVAIQSGHAVVQTGLYRLVRHPSYTGLLMAFLGLGLVPGNWLAILGLMVPVTLAVANRVVKEERALLKALGPEYAEYCGRTKRFVPGLL